MSLYLFWFQTIYVGVDLRFGVLCLKCVDCQTQEAREEGESLFVRGSAIHSPPTPCTLFSSKPIVDTSLRSPRPNRLTLLSNGKGGPLKKKRGYGNEVWRTRDASPPPFSQADTSWRRAPGSRSRNRWLIADCLLVVALWVYQNLKKSFTPPTSSIPLWESQRSGFGSNAVAQSSPLPWLLELNLD